MTFIKENLQENNYEWNTADSNAINTNIPTRRRFDRYSGYCILKMVNLFDTLITKLTLTEVKKIENLLQNSLPLEVKSELSVFNWLKEKHLQASGTGII